MLDVGGLSVAYGKHRALDDAALSMRAGEIVVILGANGAGKSSLLKAVAGIVPRLAGARLTLSGRDIGALPAHEIVEAGLALVPEGRGIFGDLTVAENLMLGAHARRARAQETANRNRVLTLFPRLAERLSQTARTMSGGEQQMVAIGRALMSAPEILLLDEPSLGLSPRLVKEIFAIVVRINREQGTTILLVEQNAAVALAVSDYAYALENGRIVAGDRAAVLRERADIQKYYLAQHDDGIGAPVQRLRRSWL